MLRLKGLIAVFPVYTNYHMVFVTETRATCHPEARNKFNRCVRLFSKGAHYYLRPICPSLSLRVYQLHSHWTDFRKI